MTRIAFGADGKVYRGVCNLEPDDNALSRTLTLLLVGNTCPAMWYRPLKKRCQVADPLNDLTRRMLSGTAQQFAATAMFLLNNSTFPSSLVRRSTRKWSSIRPSGCYSIRDQGFGMRDGVGWFFWKRLTLSCFDAKPNSFSINSAFRLTSWMRFRIVLPM